MPPVFACLTKTEGRYACNALQGSPEGVCPPRAEKGVPVSACSRRRQARLEGEARTRTQKAARRTARARQRREFSARMLEPRS